MGFTGCFFSTLGMFQVRFFLIQGEIQAWTSGMGGNPQSFHTVWVLNSWDTTWYNKTRTAIKCSSSPSSLSLSIAPSPSPTNLKQTLNGYIGLSSNYRANHQLNHWHGSIKFPYWHTSSLHYSNQRHLCHIYINYTFMIYTCIVYVLCRIFTHFNGIRQDWTSEHKNIFPKKVPSSRKSSHLSTSTTLHLCHCMGFLTSFRAPVLHGVDRWPHPNDQNLRGRLQKKRQVLNVMDFLSPCVQVITLWTIVFKTKKFG